MIAVIGEALIDFIGHGTGSRTVPFESHIGGCGINTAVAAAKAGSAVGFFCKISSDLFGKRHLEHLVGNKVMFDPTLCNAKEPSLLAFASLDAVGKASYAFYWKNSAPVSMSVEELLKTMSDHTDLRVVHIGSLALTLEPIGEVILEALERYEPKPIIFLDPNVRPSVIDDWNQYRTHIEKAIDLASFVKLSDEDLQLIHPETEVHAKAAELARTKKKHIILTLGREGAVWYGPEGKEVSHPIIDLPLADTVGAGDTFSGTILSFLHDRGYFGKEGEPPQLLEIPIKVRQEALKWASAASAINCSRPGCDPPSRKELLALLETL
ncbi:MAG TPA: PfkB family carbohydrate kinase [Sphaerochaeta sp.]|nr:PfkB family carbohydrate kinase [Sphaerochaeta sp.]HOR80439.1 PfkB family carbohydrate kinase [Sphaerochaeta sp.]